MSSSTEMEVHRNSGVRFSKLEDGKVRICVKSLGLPVEDELDREVVKHHFSDLSHIISYVGYDNGYVELKLLSLVARCETKTKHALDRMFTKLTATKRLAVLHRHLGVTPTPILTT